MTTLLILIESHISGCGAGSKHSNKKKICRSLFTYDLETCTIIMPCKKTLGKFPDYWAFIRLDLIASSSKYHAKFLVYNRYILSFIAKPNSENNYVM